MIEYIVTVVLVILLVYRSMKRPHNYPPGPPRYPIVGNIFQVDPIFPGETFKKWEKQYGKIYSLKLGCNEAVAVSDPQAIKKAFAGNDFLDRPKTYSFQAFAFFKNAGIAMSWGPYWQEHRRFAMRHLREFGFGKSRTEDSILNEITEAIKRLKKYCGEEVEVPSDLHVAVTNTIWSIISGKRMEIDCPENQRFHELVEDIVKMYGDYAHLDSFPWLRHIIPSKFLYTDVYEEKLRTMYKFFQEEVDKHKLTFNYNEEDNDLIDSYLRRFRDQMKKPDFDKEHEEFNLLAVIFDVFTGGDPIFTTTRWCILYLLKFPDIQRRIQRDVDEVTGGNRMPSLSDRTSLPFVEAFLMESLRYCQLFPEGVVHQNTVDTTILGYTIPKGTQLIPLLNAVSMDSEVWGDPEVFRPERFIDADGRILKHESYMPFSVGRRSCPGESLSKAQLFLIITCLLQQFDFECVTGNPDDVSLDSENEAFLRYPKPYKMKIKIRKL